MSRTEEQNADYLAGLEREKTAAEARIEGLEKLANRALDRGSDPDHAGFMRQADHTRSRIPEIDAEIERVRGELGTETRPRGRGRQTR